MKFYRLFLSLTILIVLFIPHSLTYALTAYHPIHELVNESDIVFIGTVTRSLTVTDNTGVPDESEIEWKKSKEGEMYGILTGRNREGGDLYCIRVDKVLYGKEKIKQAIFSKSRIGAINRNLKRNRKRNPVKLFAFQKRRRGVSLPLEAAAYYENESQLFFLKVSKFPKNLPDTLKILDRKRSPNGSGSELQRLTKADLTEKFYFEACFKDRQATWLLTEERSKKMRPTVEVFCELVQRQQRLRELRDSNTNSDNKSLINICRVAVGGASLPRLFPLNAQNAQNQIARWVSDRNATFLFRNGIRIHCLLKTRAGL